VDADDPVRCPAAHLRGDPGAAAVALDAVPVIAEAGHELGEGRRDLAGVPARRGERPGESDAGGVGDHDVEVGRERFD